MFWKLKLISKFISRALYYKFFIITLLTLIAKIGTLRLHIIAQKFIFEILFY